VPAANTNNNPIARAARTLGVVDANNKEGESVADTMQKPVDAAPASAIQTTTVAAAAGGPKLQGIFYSAKNASVIINGKSMKVGDEADGVKVLEIKQGSVRVQSGADVRELTMK
jgi:hypothetical protein